MSGLGINAAHLMRGQMVADPLNSLGVTAQYGYPLFHTHARPQLYSGWPARSSNASTDPCTGVSLAYLRAGCDSSKLPRLPGDRCERGGLMTRGLGRIPSIRGTHAQARDEADNDISAGRYMTALGRTGHPAEGASGQGMRTGSPSGRRSPGLAPGALGWPWHPRRLATARHRGHGMA